VIVGGLMAALILGIYLLPTLYVWVAGDSDILPQTDLQAGEEV
jgi:cobalt-zinc-cadmium resistance protein CzcA